MTHTSTIFLVLRRLRTPLIVLITLFAVSVLGLTLMPGPLDPNGGQMPRMSFFHAVYFISYTATTIGFGEIPYAFSEQQRPGRWCASTCRWSAGPTPWAPGVRDAAGQELPQRSGGAALRPAGPAAAGAFFLVCGYGEAGHLICQASTSSATGRW